MKAHLDAVTQLYQPNREAIRKSLPALAESLHNAAIDLAHDLTLERLDRLSAQLNSAQDNLRHLRKAMIAENGATHGHGTG